MSSPSCLLSVLCSVTTLNQNGYKCAMPLQAGLLNPHIKAAFPATILLKKQSNYKLSNLLMQCQLT